METRISYAAIVDDDPSDAGPLVNVLSKNGVYAQYYNGEAVNLPNSAPGGIRVLFLDLHLDAASFGEKNVKSKLVGVLTRLIGTSNGPYIILAWTQHIDEVDYLKEVIEVSNGIFEKPIDVITVKKEYAKENGSYDFTKIEDLVSKAISAYPAMQFLMEWERSSVRGVRNTTTFLTSEAQSDNESLRCLIQNLARAELNDISDVNVALKNSVFVLNKILLDELDGFSSGQEFELEGFPCSCEEGMGLSNTNGVLTRKLNIRQEVSNDTPGAIYEIEPDTFSQLKDDDVVDHLDNNNSLKNMLVRKIVLDVSPLCDYAQGKLKLRRFVPGYLFQIDYEVNLNPPFLNKGRADYLYHSKEFDFKSKRTWISLNLKFFTALSKTQCNPLNDPIFALREVLLSEIQHRIANHVERVGVYTFVNKESS